MSLHSSGLDLVTLTTAAIQLQTSRAVHKIVETSKMFEILDAKQCTVQKNECDEKIALPKLLPLIIRLNSAIMKRNKVSNFDLDSLIKKNKSSMLHKDCSTLKVKGTMLPSSAD